MKGSSIILTSSKLDKTGIMCSGACAIHCMLSPIVALASPAIARFFENEWIHIGLLVFLTPVAIFAFYRGFKLHKRNLPILLGSVGIAILLIAVAFESLLKVELEYLEVILTIIGCILLILAHVFNIKYIGTPYSD